MPKRIKYLVVFLGIALGTATSHAQTVTTEMMAQGKMEGTENDDAQGVDEAKETGKEKPEEIAEASFPTKEEKSRTLSLEQAYRMAERNNPEIKNIDEKIYQADVFILTAWSKLLPNVSGNASITRNQREISVPFPDPAAPGVMDEIVVQDLWNRSVGFSVNMALLNPRSFPGIKMAYDATERERLEAQVSKNNLMFSVTSAYYQVNSFRELIAVQEENLKIALEFQKRSEALKKAGKTTNIDVVRAQIEVMDAERQLEDARDSYQNAKKALAYLIGLEGDFETKETERIDESPGNSEEMKEQAVAKRAEIKSAEVYKRSARRAETEVWMRWLPSFDVTFNWNWSSAGGFAGENDSWMLIFGAKWSLLEGGSRIAEMKTKKSFSRVAENEIRRLEIIIKKEIDENIVEVRRTKRNLEYTEKKVALAEENHHLITRQYKVGLVSSLDVVEATSELALSRINRVVERLKYELAVLKLKKSAGDYHSLSVVPK